MDKTHYFKTTFEGMLNGFTNVLSTDDEFLVRQYRKNPDKYVEISKEEADKITSIKESGAEE